MGSRQRGAVVGCLSPSHYTFRETLVKRGLARGYHAPALKGSRRGQSCQRIVHALGRLLIGAWDARAGGGALGRPVGFEKENPKFVW